MLEASFRLAKGTFVLELDLAAEPGITVLFGPSGSGKSLTLRAIAGMVEPDAGRIAVDGAAVFDRAAGISVPPHRRGFGYAGQRPALFPHLTVRQNVAFGLRDHSRADRDAVTSALLARFGLAGFEQRRVGSLSGGQAQRVALARALAPGHRVLLLDEPFSALDEALRQDLRALLNDLARERELVIIFVTHDLREAHLLADRLAVLDGGRVLQAGPRDAVFRAPSNRRVAELLGAVNVFPATVIRRDDSTLVFTADGWEGLAASWSSDPLPGQAVDVMIRPERVVMRRGAPTINALPARIVREFDYGNSRVLHFEPDGAGPRLVVELASRPYDVLDVRSRKSWTLELPPEDLHVMPALARAAR
ncbi:MAG: ABC transporter [Tepidiforma sp.]|nr:MAG: ABC transporter [Tepidiforma sp.]